MNFRTTILLAGCLAGLGIFYVVTQSRERAAVDNPEPTVAKTIGTSEISKDLLEEKLGDVIKVVIEPKGADEPWVLEKMDDAPAGTLAEWRITSPIEMPATSAESARFGLQFNSLQYDISFSPDEAGGVSEEAAGLSPPQAVVTVTDVDGATVAVEIGNLVSRNETYVRLKGQDKVCIGKADLKSLLKPKVVDFGDRNVWRFPKDQVTSLEITDRSDSDNPVVYRFAKHDGQWMFESPVTAKATSKVNDALQGLAFLRTTKWLDEKEERFALFGLAPANLTVRVTVEKEMEIEDDSEEAPAAESADEESENASAEPTTRIEVETYELHVSDRSPIGEETKVYVRTSRQPVVGVIMKSVADKFRPIMREWREMRITTVAVHHATSIQITTPQGSTNLIKPVGSWKFENDGLPAEQSAVSDLLTAIGDMNAVSFVEMQGEDLSAHGFDDPQVEIRLTLPGVEDVERITVGGFTDENVKRLVYVRRNDVSSIAKVKTTDIKALLAPLRSYRDRTIVDIASSRITRCELHVDNPIGDGKTHVVLEHDADGWKMTAPVQAAPRGERVAALVEAFGKLRAESIVADEEELTAYGLHAPSATLTVTYEPPPTYRVEMPAPDDADDGNENGNPTKVAPVAVESEPETITLSVSQHEGNIYAKRSDAPAIYKIDRSFYDRLMEEYRSGEVLSFDESKVQRFSIRSGEDSYAFVRKDGSWSLDSVPDLPLDQKKVDNLLLQIGDLQAYRFASQVDVDLDSFGLAEPLLEVSVDLEDGTVFSLKVSDKRAEVDPQKGRYAKAGDVPGVFLLPADVTTRIHVNLDDLQKK